jgi:hypothetical protein
MGTCSPVKMRECNEWIEKKTPGENEGVGEYDLGTQWHVQDVQTFWLRVLTHDRWHFIQTFGGYVWGPYAQLPLKPI